MNKRKPKPQKRKQPDAEDSSAARFPAEPFASVQEHHAIAPYGGAKEEDFDPKFPGKQRPSVQYLIDADWLRRKVKDLPAFLAALKDMMRFYDTYAGLAMYRPMLQNFTYEVHKRAEELRQEYNDKYDAIIPPCPNDFYMIEPWRADAEREIRRRKSAAGRPCVDLRRWKKSHTRNLMQDLLEDEERHGVPINPFRHADPTDLRKRLKKPKHGLVWLVDAIKAVGGGEVRTYKLALSKDEIDYIPPGK